jgi:hypothetical protein
MLKWLGNFHAASEFGSQTIADRSSPATRFMFLQTSAPACCHLLVTGISGLWRTLSADDGPIHRPC